MQIILSLSKMFNFDSQLVLEAYEQEEKQKIQSLSEQRLEMLTKINKAVQELAAMMVQLNENSQFVADSANRMAQLQEKANDNVQLLHSKIGEINAVGSLLRKISDQTHLLGLNAAIEAAHAGEHGRGFGIVANEIRKLAANSKESLATIEEKLNEITSVLNEVLRDSEQTSKLAQEQSASSQELASFVHMIKTVTNELENIN